jgi:hypothetical protein
LYDFKVFKNADGNTEFDGLFGNSHVSIELKTLMKYVNELVSFAKSIKLPVDIKISGITDESSIP